MVGLFVPLAIIVIASGSMPGRIAYDQKLYHDVAVAQFVREWPRFDFYDYLSATTPGFHVFMAGVVRAAGGGWESAGRAQVMQIASACVSVVFFGLIAWLAGRRAGGLKGLACAMPCLASVYLFTPGVYAIPDNFGWLLVLAILAIALSRKVTLAGMVVGCALLVLLVGVRQIHAWTGGLLLVAAYLGSETSQNQSGSVGEWLFGGWGTRMGRAALAGLAVVPAALVLLYFVNLWSGLVPPRFATWYIPKTLPEMLRTPAPAFVLAMIGVYGLAYVGIWGGALHRLWTTGRVWLFTAALAGLGLGLLSPTTYNYDAGRRTGIWNFADRSAVAGYASPMIVGLAVLGAIILAAMLSQQRTRERLVLLAALVGFCVSLAPSVEVWQRYVDPMVLIVLALMASRGVSAAERVVCIAPIGVLARLWPAARTLAWVGPLLLSAAMALQTARSIVGPGAERVTAAPPPAMSVNHQGKVPPCLQAAPDRKPGRWW
jgi:hypothetical protein